MSAVQSPGGFLRRANVCLFCIGLFRTGSADNLKLFALKVEGHGRAGNMYQVRKLSKTASTCLIILIFRMFKVFGIGECFTQ